jgi:hypothetical protein
MGNCIDKAPKKIVSSKLINTKDNISFFYQAYTERQSINRRKDLIAPILNLELSNLYIKRRSMNANNKNV